MVVTACGQFGGLRLFGDLNLDEQLRPIGPRIHATQRWHVVVVASPADSDVTVTDVEQVRRVEPAPLAAKPLNPRVRLAGNRLADFCVTTRVQVPGDIPSRDSDVPQGAEREVGDVLADPLASDPRVGGGR